MLALLLAAMLQASQPPAQQLFDQATAAIDAGKYAEADAILEPLVARLSGAPKSASLALARLRLAEVQQAQGQFTEAAATLQAALSSGALDTPALDSERVAGMTRLGVIEVELEDDAAALAQFDAAAKLAADPMQRANALGRAVSLSMFTEASAAIARAQEAVAIADKSASTADIRASYHTLLGRALLNAGRFDDARKELDIAVKLEGGLTSRTSVLEAMARGDLAIAYMLMGKPEDARKYMAYTGMGGAGYAGGPFTIPAENLPPSCDEDSGIRPDDMVIVEFKVGDDGVVSGVQPIYASRQGTLAFAFARAVKQWSWRPRDAALIKPFYREAARIEMRCATTGGRPYMLSVLKQDVSAWLASKGIAPMDVDDADARAYPKEIAALARQEAASGTASTQLVPILTRIVFNSVTPRTARADAAARADSIVRAANAPAPVVAFFAISHAAAEAARTKVRARTLVSPLTSDPAIVGDPRARAVVRLALAEGLGARDRIPILQQVADDQALAATDPLRVGALVRLASAEALLRDFAAARAAYDRSGLSDQMCAVVDAHPDPKSVNTGGEMFPVEAMQWGFEGWAVTNFDVTADGHTSNVRAVIAYPPLVFGGAAVKVLNTARYTQSYRPSGGAGCSGAVRSVRFGMPFH